MKEKSFSKRISILFAVVYILILLLCNWIVRTLYMFASTPQLLQCGVVGKLKDSQCTFFLERSHTSTPKVFFTGDSKIVITRDNVIEIRSLYLNFPGVGKKFKHPYDVRIVSMSNDKSKIAACVADTTSADRLWIWDVNSGKLIKKSNYPFGECYGRHIDFSFDNSRIVVSDPADHDISFLYDLSTDSRHEIPGDLTTISNDKIATRTDRKAVLVMNLSDSRILRTFKVGDESIMDLVFSPDGHLLAAHTAKGDIYVWDVDTGERLWLFSFQNRLVEQEPSLLPSYPTCDLVFSPDSRKIASCNEAGVDEDPDPEKVLFDDGKMQTYVVVYSLESGAVLGQFQFEKNLRPYSVDFSPDGQSIVLGTFQYVLIYKLR
jgi:WD40 repeat protein